MVVDKSKMKEEGRNYKTQAIFVETSYDYDAAVYTLKEEDFTGPNGVVYPSLKRLYLEANDPTEYTFATTHLLGWKQWQRLCENKIIRAHIDEWREELEMKLRSKAVKQMIAQAASGGFQANKWLNDMGWSVRGAGRPSKREIEASKKDSQNILESYGEDVLRLIKK